MILIRAGRVLRPAEGLDLKADVVLNGDRITGVFPADQGETEGAPGFSPRERTHRQIIKVKRLVAAPELVDVHARFHDPDPTYEEDIHTGTRAAAKGGFTTVVCMADTDSIADNEKIPRYVLGEGKKIGIYMLGCTAASRGFTDRELTDIGGLLTARVAGFADDGVPLMDGAPVRMVMEEAARLDTVLSFHERDRHLIRENRINHGGILGELGIYDSPILAEDSLVARDCMAALDAGTTMGIQYISSGHSVEMVRLAKRLGAKIWVEVTPHHSILTEEAVLKHGILAKMNPPLRAEKDKQMLVEGLKNETTDMITTDHAPRSREEKERPLIQTPSGILGLETTLALGIVNLVKTGHLTLLELMEKVSLNPARLYKLGCGRMESGAPADLMLFNTDRQWTVEGFEPKSASSLFLGETLAGKVMCTVCGGKVVYGEQGTEV